MGEKLTFLHILCWLMTEVMHGRAHFVITRGLGRKDRKHAWATAPTFFQMTLNAHAEAAQLCAARIFDRSGAASIHRLISSATKEKASFKHGSAVQVEAATKDAENFVTRFEPIVTAIRTRRNQTIAHTDARPLTDPAGYIKAGRVSYAQLEELFDKTGATLNRFDLLFRGKAVPLELEGVEDYNNALDLISRASIRSQNP
jgi:hypothetical protein